MKRTPLKRKAPLRSGSVLPKRNRKRAAMRKERDFGPYADWIRQQWCAVFHQGVWCWFAATQKYGEPAKWCDADHVRTRGAGGRATGNLVPLCRGHHEERHRIGRKSFEAKYRISLSGVASALAARWKEETGR